MVDIELDGFYCKKCKELHPTLFWHELYDEYIKTEKDFVLDIKQISERFGNKITDKEAAKLYQEYRTSFGVEFCDNSKKCIVCGTNTHYKIIGTDKFVCSNKCKETAE